MQVSAHTRTAIAALSIVASTSLCTAQNTQSGWDEDSPLPNNAVRAVSDLATFASPLFTDASDLRTSGSSLTTSLADLLGGLKGLRVEENDLEFRIIFEADILFDFDKASIRRDAEPTLQAVAEALLQFKDKRIRLVGHTDSKGSDSYNLNLSKKRAESVKKWLTAQPSLTGAHLVAEGKGESEPRVANTLPDGKDDPDGRQKNRRVEIHIPKR